MPIENEYKYVLRYDHDLPEATGAYACVIQQGYLSSETRIRLIEMPGKKGANRVGFFTFKRNTPDGLVEIETELDPLDFDRLWPSTHNRLEKVRFSFNEGAVRWDVDLFGSHDEPYFVLAEAEVPEGEPEPIICERLAGWLIKPVGKDPAFTSYKLADEAYARNLMATLR
jgi:CYTH domain-containing protein